MSADEMFWADVIKAGPNGLLHLEWSVVENDLPPHARRVFRSFLDSLDRQAKFCAAQVTEIEMGARRVETIGLMLHRAGLRSYTDADGRIYVATEVKP